MAAATSRLALLMLALLGAAAVVAANPMRTAAVSSRDRSRTYQEGDGLLAMLGPLPRLMNRWLAGSSGTCTPGTKLTHSVAMAMCQAAGIGIRSSTGRIGCRDPGCTSLEQVRCDTVLGILGFGRASGCPGIVITGGTEMGHGSGTYSHYNGYKLDIALTACVTGYVQESFRFSRTRRDGAKVYVDGRGNEYALEKSHWDILYWKI